ncbi:MAG: hypothetical protein ACRBCS_01780 [Cellvibrionaceae bacterium]
MNNYLEKFISDNPIEIIDRQLDSFEQSNDTNDAFIVEYPFTQYYLPKSPVIILLALVVIERDGTETKVAATVLSQKESFVEELSSVASDWSSIFKFCSNHQLPLFVFNEPVLLQPIDIPKPWGKEVWYTGIEERGQSLVSDGIFSIPLPWLLSIGEKYWLDQNNTSLILLKILDPLPEPVFGDLYFEMHEEKKEVYVVTHIDQQAWPEGKGGIRFGFNQEKRQQLANDSLFKEKYLDVVKKYQKIRNEIDAHLDILRKKELVGLNDPVSAAKTQQWLVSIDKGLIAHEAELRKEMESFIHVEPLTVGDVIKVPTHTPHSLMHGVRTIEFQTPVYERKILSFAQKVLTQSHWDTESAIDIVSLDAPSISTLDLISQSSESQCELVVRFDDFEVVRVTFFKSGDLCFDLKEKYAVVISVFGDLRLDDKEIKSEQAMLVPGNAQTMTIQSDTGKGILLVAVPV